MILVLHTILLIYCFAIIALIYGFTKVNSFESLGLKPKTKFSIIVPFRNEGNNLPKLLDSLSKLKYPFDFFEVILVDDDSEEVFSVQDVVFSVKIINNIRVSNSPKKDAITTAMNTAKNEWIITTDADCVVNENWLLALDNYIQINPVSMIAGAVTYDFTNSFLHHFQQLDLASLQGATMGSFGIGKGFMCNGANLAYQKSFFEALNGFEGNNKIASGDDVFLLQKAMAKYPNKVHYLKSSNTIVITKPLNDWKSLFYQRVRWAAKTSSYQSRIGIGLGLIVFGENLSFLLVIGCWLVGFGNTYLWCFSLLAKILVDFILIHKTNRFLINETRFYLISSFLYPFFSVIVVLYSLFFGKYEWKGRIFSK
ncbi:glycosyltransferase family 2 protein [Flavobacterium cellulosilyticum]|uniref:Glycosyltransferase n=1 Tax=Flavobacterium cellulosilyticum TaxID=2541731 RepID=A0A4R5C6B7_9FLAO|nr:glycosyltransferase [Flavobacterium cellulosilyticum]TDD94585.1 glycosyltransferase [Flavobacterium cellulosilyticum]